MAEVMRMPAVLAGAEEAAVQTWLVSVGVHVAIDQPLAEIETDKAIVELTAETAGTIGGLLVREGDSVAVGDPILVLLAEGEQQDAARAAMAAAGLASPLADSAGVTSASAPPEPETAPEASQEASSGAPQDPQAVNDLPPAETATRQAADANGRRLFASPLVRKLARERGLDLAAVVGTGPNGRIVRRDIELHRAESPAVSASAPSALAVLTPPDGRTLDGGASDGAEPADGSAFTDVPLSRMRRTIARRLTDSKSTVPHFYLVADCRVDELLALRASINETAVRKISVNDLVLKAVAGAFVDVPDANAVWNADSIRHFSSVDIAVAVATGDGLVTPVVRGVERRTLTDLSTAVGELAERARQGRLRQHELEGGSFAVSNLGMYGTAQFTAILNPPQSGILAVGAARVVPVVGDDGALTTGAVLTVTLSADHRVIDGALGAQWLAAFQRRIEKPLTILI